MANKKTSIDAKLLKHMFINGAEELAKHYAYIDELNVFPVPDGDTGTNMKVTLEGAANTIKDIEYTDLFQLGKQFARGLLMNARGNSGVITSQIFKGLTGLFVEGQTECDVPTFVDCFDNARKVAYAAVSNPIEGTILTVIRVTAEKLIEKKSEFTSIDEVLDFAITAAEEILSKTPDMLPELKEVGVVDSGGYGLCKILTGMNNALDIEMGRQVTTKAEIVQPKKTLVSNFKDDNEGFGYCNEFIMTLGSKVDLKQKDKAEFDLTDFKEAMNRLGDCLVVVVDDQLVKVHIHSTKPYEILKFASQYGEFNKVKVENMTLQFLERNPGTTLEELVNKKKGITEWTGLSNETKIIATVPTMEVGNLYKNTFGIDTTIETDKHGNPSVQDFIDAFKKAKSNKIILIVDDGNYMLAAKETIELLPKSMRVELFNSGSVANSYLLCLAYNPHDTWTNNIRNLNKQIAKASVGRVSVAVKPVKYKHINVKKGEYIGIIGKNIVSSNKNLMDSTKDLVTKLYGKSKHAYLFYGGTCTIREAEELAKYLRERYLIETEIFESKQKNYFFTIALI